MVPIPPYEVVHLSSEESDEELADGGIEEVPLAYEQADSGPGTSFTPPRNKSNIVGRYISSSSAKKRKIKEMDCMFCVKYLEGSGFVDHLKKEILCRNLYLRSFKLKSYDNLLLKLFSCEFCFERRQMDFKKHLSRNNRCLEGYRRKFMENNLEILCKKVRALRRTAMPSRSAAARALVYKKERREAQLNKSTASSLNDYITSIMLSNYKLCIICHSNFGEYSAREVKKHDDLFEKLKLDDSSEKYLRRFEKFFVCNQCENDSEDRNEESFEQSLKLSEASTENHIKFFPDEELGTLASQSVTEPMISLMVPTNLDSLGSVEQLHKVKGRNDVLRKIYESGNVTRSTISAIYENEVSKYKKMKEAEDKYVAVVKDFVTKELSDVEKLNNSSRITCSDGWFAQQKNEMNFRRDQFGSFHITVKIDLPPGSFDVMATNLIQEGFVVSIDKQGSSNGEFKLLYSVHDHKSDEDCPEDCGNKTKLEDFLKNGHFDISSLGNKHIGTYVSSVHQKLISFAKNIVEAPASELFSENYHLPLIFDSSGKASIVGCIWPAALDKVNLDFAMNTGRLTKKNELKECVERSISTSSDPRLLRSSFHLSEVEANEVSILVKEHQFHICDFNDCSTCTDCDLPSVDTILKECCSDVNLLASKKFKVIMKNKLNSMTLQEKKSTSTFDWLEKVWETVTGEINDNCDVLSISFDEEQDDLIFEIDDRLALLLKEYSQSPLTGAYHYAISCSSVHDEVQVVLKRLRIVDCFTQPFNPLLIKACNSPIFVQVVSNNKMFENLISPDKANTIPEQANPKLAFSHRLVSLAEAVSLMDKTKRRFKSSSIIEFVNAAPNRRVILKKAQEHSEDNFFLEGCDDEYQLVENNISRHFRRMNGKGLLLAETVSWYDYVGKEKSKELYKIYADSNVPNSEVKCVCSEGTLPNFIWCKNGDVLRKRLKQKTIVYPKPKSSYDKMYSRCLLFFPISTGSYKRHEARRGFAGTFS